MRFLLQFRGLHNDLRLAEFYAALSAVRDVPESRLAADLSVAYSHICGTDTPTNPSRGDAGAVLYGEIFFYAELKSEFEAEAVARRTVLLRGIYAPIGHGDDYASCVRSIDKPPFTGGLEPLRDEKKRPSFRCCVDAFGKSVSVERQLDKIHVFGDVLRTLPGRVRLKAPDYELCILEDAFPRRGHGRRTSDEQPRQVFLARKIANGQGHIRATYSLKQRRYIGPTSMDAELAFVMANMARVKEGHLVHDPFCGTGGVLVACAVRGAVCVGADINILALRGKGPQTDIAANFHQYGLSPPVGLLRADVMHPPVRPRSRRRPRRSAEADRGESDESGGNDASRETGGDQRRGGWFDAIVCDPPYGIKEGTRAFRADRISADLRDDHFQGTERVRFVDFLHGVLCYAADTLVDDGRLVYWLPTTTGYSPDDVPCHPALEVVHNNVQPLTSRMSRRLITMRRLPDAETAPKERRRHLAHRGETQRVAAATVNSTRLSRSESESESESELDAHGVGNGLEQRLPAHFDLACKLLRQPERAERRIPHRNGIS